MTLLSSVLMHLLYEPVSSFYFSALCLISVLFVLKLVRRNKYILPPSPPKLPIIGNLHQLGTLPHRSFQALSRKYGPLMMLQLGQIPTLVVSSADVVREITKTHDVVFSNRPQPTAAKIFLYGCKDVGFASYGDEWRQMKKACVVELLSQKKVRSFRSIREEVVAELVEAIREACADERSCVNLTEMLIAASNNIVSRCVIGRKCDDTLGDGSSCSFGVLGRKIMRLFSAFSVGDFFPSLSWVDFLTGLIPEMKATFVTVDAIFDDVIAEHESRNRKHDESDITDFVGILLQLQDRGRLDFELNRHNLKAILMDMIIGGSDTTSTTLEWAFAELLRNPDTMMKAQEEVRRVVGINSRVDENCVNKMNYLKCVVKETLRLHPPVPLLIARETTSGVKLRGYDIPPKTRVFINAWAIQRDPELWDNPEEFFPERFENSQIDLNGQDFQLIPFGTGRRVCPGISFGLASTEYVLANLLYWFKWKMPETGALMQNIDMRETSGLTVSKKAPLHLEPETYDMIM
ncbi:steroid 17alpha-monooxygenase or 17alpha-hydroxyprogesterone aldolase [Spatholobus suberectus]|nr:steroid 17alpha-monooxygenase or 17alpha-hydroxyprogesterone aldolase [Spatholobus suberectus]